MICEICNKSVLRAREHLRTHKELDVSQMQSLLRAGKAAYNLKALESGSRPSVSDDEESREPIDPPNRPPRHRRPPVEPITESDKTNATRAQTHESLRASGLDRGFNNDPQLDQFKNFLSARAGENKPISTASQYATYLGRYLYFANPSCITWNAVVNTDSITEYVNILDNETYVQASTMQNMLEAIASGIRYGIEKKDLASKPQQVLVAQTLIKRLKKSYVRAKNDRRRAKDVSAEDLPDDRCLAKLDNLRAKFKDVVRKGSSIVELNWATSYLVSVLVLKNTQRPGAVQNMTLNEMENGYWGVEKHSKKKLFTIRVQRHKTSAQFGPAAMTLNSYDHPLLVDYVNVIRPQLLALNNVDERSTVFVNTKGEPLKNISNKSHLYKIQREAGMPQFSCTTHRKAVSTKAAHSMTTPMVQLIADQQTHSLATTQKYYVASCAKAREQGAYALLEHMRVRCREALVLIENIYFNITERILFHIFFVCRKTLTSLQPQW